MPTFDEIQEAQDRMNQQRHIAGKHIVLVEGAAGSGKTELCGRLSALPHVGLVRRSLGKRQFQTKEAGKKSFLNDYHKMMEALLLPQSVVLVDRCIASQKVYHAIRTGKNISYHPPAEHLAIDTLKFLEDDLSWRLDRWPREIKVYWLFLIPSSNALNHRRETGGKEYPNRASDEILFYKKLSNKMIIEGTEVLRPSYEDLEDQDFIVRGFELWLEHYPYLNFATMWRCFATMSKEK